MSTRKLLLIIVQVCPVVVIWVFRRISLNQVSKVMSFYWCVDEIQDLQNLMRQESHVESQFVSHQQWSDIAEDDNILEVHESHFVALNRTFLNQIKTS